jgi:hypothetical protein
MALFRGGDEPWALFELVDVQLLEHLLEDLAGLEFDDGALGDDNFGLGLIGVASNAGFAALDLEYTKIAQLNVTAFCQSAHDDIESHLYRSNNFLLREIGLLIDFQNDFSLGEVGIGGGHLCFGFNFSK